VPALGPAKATYERNQAYIQTASLETFVQKQARQYAVRMQVLEHVLERTPESLLLRYEDMVNRPSEWLSSLCDFLRVDLSPQFTAWVIKETCTVGLLEDVSRHKRQIHPGDFRRKLSPNIQDRLTSMLRPQLDAFGYR
jgi:hypothetical protein